MVAARATKLRPDRKRDLIKAYAAARAHTPRPSRMLCLLGILISFLAIGAGWLVTFRSSLHTQVPANEDALLQVVRQSASVFNAPVTSTSPTPSP